MLYESWTYEQYGAVYDACNGITTHSIPAVGIKDWYKNKLSRQEFDGKLAMLLEIESHDDSYLDDHPEYGPDESYDDAWMSMELRSDLFLIEYKKASKIVEAAKEGVSS